MWLHRQGLNIQEEEGAVDLKQYFYTPKAGKSNSVLVALAPLYFQLCGVLQLLGL